MTPLRKLLNMLCIGNMVNMLYTRLLNHTDKFYLLPFGSSVCGVCVCVLCM